jgi:hypothetical protein
LLPIRTLKKIPLDATLFQSTVHFKTWCGNVDFPPQDGIGFFFYLENEPTETPSSLPWLFIVPKNAMLSISSSAPKKLFLNIIGF